MFSYWKMISRHSKQRNSYAGQIFPVLLICIVGLLVAVAVTKRVGDANINQTSADNAADSGSLSAASCWAGGFNRLVYRNWDQDSEEAFIGDVGHWGRYMGYSVTPFNQYYYYKEMKKYYDQMRGTYEELKLEADKYLKDADDLLKQAIELAKTTKGLIPTEDLVCAQTWPVMINSINPNLIQIAVLINQASYKVGAFNACTAYMGNGQGCDNGVTNCEAGGCDNGVTNCNCNEQDCDNEGKICDGPLKNGVASWFRENQLHNLCDAFAFMEETHERGIQTGQYYAMNNSGYPSKLSLEQGDQFNFWLGGGAGGSFPGGGSTVSFAPAVPPGEPEACRITATLELPAVASYEILMADWNFPQDHTLNSIEVKWSCTCCCCFACKINLPSKPFPDDPFNYRASKKVTEDLMVPIPNFFICLAGEAIFIYNKTVEGANCCPCVCNGSYIPCGGTCGVPPEPMRYLCDWQTPYNTAEDHRDCLKSALEYMIERLEQIRSNPKALNTASVKTFKEWNEDIWLHLWPESPSETESILLCREARDYSDVAPAFPGMMVVNIKDVTLDDEWKDFCEAEISCGATSTSRSKFTGYPGGGTGELVGEFSDIYYPEITTE